MLKTAPYKHMPNKFVIVQSGTHQLSSKGDIFPLHSTKCAFKSQQSALKAISRLTKQGYEDLRIYCLQSEYFLSYVMPFDFE